MENSTLTKTQIQRQLFKDYGLIYDGDPTSKDNDVFKHKHFTIITRSGIEKIQKAANIVIDFKPLLVSETAVILQATGSKLRPDGTLESVFDKIDTFASATAATTNSGYLAEIAEKRAMSRIVLKLAGLYEYGVFGADETDEWKDEAGKKRATYKGE